MRRCAITTMIKISWNKYQANRCSVETQLYNRGCNMEDWNIPEGFDICRYCTHINTTLCSTFRQQLRCVYSLCSRNYLFAYIKSANLDQVIIWSLIIVKLNFIKKNTTVCFMQQLESLKRRFPSTTYLQLPHVYMSATNTEWVIKGKKGTREAQIDFPFRKAENIQIRQPQ